MFLILLPIAFPALIALIDFLGFLYVGRQVVNKALFRMAEIGGMIVLPWMYGNFGMQNECCGDEFATAVFSPTHQLTIEVIIGLCLIAYFYSSYRKKIATPVIEVIVNALLLIGIILNLFIAIHTNETLLAIGGNMPIILFAVLVLAKNQRFFIDYARQSEFIPHGRVEKLAWNILQLKPIVKFPLIFVLCLPMLSIISAILLLVGQKPDSIIRAFTDTYKHGLSQWDYKCDNVNCGGHFLCSVGAIGHHRIVKPQRLGIRNGGTIVCSRQLLIANAFEDLLQKSMPVFHKFIRRQYDNVGSCVHRFYWVFDNRAICDLVYFLMKPLEWIFLLSLYTFCKKPENRIAIQYISEADRKGIENLKRPQKLETKTTAIETVKEVDDCWHK